jgi:predicted lipid-binding transport protein (Tim44 family)
MSITSKLSMLSVLALLIAAPAAAAQLPATEGDYYAPTNTVVQQPTAAQVKQAQEGDFYAPTNANQVSAQRSAAMEKCTAQADAKFGPGGDVNWRRFNHDAYAECMTGAGQAE